MKPIGGWKSACLGLAEPAIAVLCDHVVDEIADGPGDDESDPKAIPRESQAGRDPDCCRRSPVGGLAIDQDQAG